MKKLFFTLMFVLLSSSTFAQIPYFAGAPKKSNLYGYTSIKFRPGINKQETYTTFQYGLGSGFATGLDLYTSVGESYMGVLLRYGSTINKYFAIGCQVTPSFNLNSNMKLSYTTAALYMNGAITNDGNFFWCSNTWYGANIGAPDTITNFEYLGYCFSFKNRHSITPMVGAIHSWKFNQDVDIAAGFYYNISNFNFYLWGNDFLKNNPRIIIGIDFLF